MSKKDDTASAIKLIADAAAEASKTIAEAASQALKVKREEDTGDHNLLIRLDTKVDQIQADVLTLKNQDKNNITQEQHQSLCNKSEDIETRMRSAETSITKLWTYGSALVVALGILEFIINKYF